MYFNQLIIAIYFMASNPEEAVIDITVSQFTQSNQPTIVGPLLATLDAIKQIRFSRSVYFVDPRSDRVVKTNRDK